MFVITYRKFFYAFSTLTVLLAFAAIIFFGLHFSIDFTGGSQLEVAYPGARPDATVVSTKVNSLGLGIATVRPSNNDSFIIQTPVISNDQENAVLSAITFDASDTPVVKEFDAVGPTLGKELEGRAILSIIIVILAIVLFIAFAFRGVSKPVSSYKYGYVAIIALVHDVILPVGFFSLLGHIYGLQVDTLIVTAILVILGYSINDTIVIFDRIRENLRRASDGDRQNKFDTIVGTSLRETFGRSINTSATVLVALIVLYFLGGEATRTFALALIVGVIAGTYSSIFLAAPILVSLKKAQDKRNAKKK